METIPADLEDTLELPVLPGWQDMPEDDGEPLEDEPAVTACTSIEGHEYEEQADWYCGRRLTEICCVHCGDPAPEGVRHYKPLPVWFGSQRL